MLKDFTKLFLKHTLPSRRHLTPELVLRLITPSCELWSSPVESSPFIDPFWGFYWPGGQATARYLLQKSLVKLHGEENLEWTLGSFVYPVGRYILDNPNLLKHRRVLDVGCGCGAGAIAAARVGAKAVVANDIDKYALIASKVNAELNAVCIKTDANNHIGSSCDHFDAVLIGDMFYNEEFAEILFNWLNRLSENGKTVLIGDPGRHGLTQDRQNRMTLLASYDLPKETREENHGFTQASVWMLNKL